MGSIALAKKVKLTRKEIKGPDEFITTSVQVMEYLQDHVKPIVIGLGAFVAVIIIITGIAAYSASLESKAMDATAVVQSSLEPLPTGEGEEPVEITPAMYKDAAVQFSEVYGEFSRTNGGKMAVLYAGDAFFKAKEYDLAIEQYEKFLSVFSGEPLLMFLAKESLGYAYEGKEEFAKAAEQFEKTITPEAGENRMFGIINAARCYQASGNKEKAVTLYEQFIQEYPESTLQNLAKERLTVLKAEIETKIRMSKL